MKIKCMANLLQKNAPRKTHLFNRKVKGGKGKHVVGSISSAATICQYSINSTYSAQVQYVTAPCREKNGGQCKEVHC
jgi:hypothetical protein